MKKALIPFLIISVLIIAMTTGSFAIYTQTKTLRGQIYTRVFLFRANEKTTSQDMDIGGLSLAPGEGEKELYRFELTNTDGSAAVSDYDMTATITSSGMSNAHNAMDGLIFRLYNLSLENSSPVVISGGELQASGIQYQARVKQTIQYKLTVEWKDTGSPESQTAVASSGKTYPISLTVKASGGN